MTSRPAAMLVHETMKLCWAILVCRKNSCGDQRGGLFTRKTFLSLQDICIASDHASENDLFSRAYPKKQPKI